MKLKTCLNDMEQMLKELREGKRKEPVYCRIGVIWYENKDGNRWVPHSDQEGNLLNKRGCLK